MRRVARFLGALGAVLGALVTPLGAQGSELVAEVGGSWVLPPTGVDGGAAGFLVAGLRGALGTPGVSGAHASVRGGRALDAGEGGDFVSAEVGGEAWRSLGRGWSTGVDGRAFLFGVEAPFDYRAGGGEGAVSLRYGTPTVKATVSATGGVGRSTATITRVVRDRRRQEQRPTVLEDDLERYGGAAEVLLGRGPLIAGVAGGLHRGGDGSYRSLGLRLLAGHAGGVLELRLDGWSTPDGRQTTGGFSFHLPVGGWSLRGSVGRPDPDPLLRDEPGRGAGGLLIGRRILGSDPADEADGFRRGRPVHALLGTTETGQRVRFTLAPPEEAAQVAVLGDFTVWESVALTPVDGRWSVEVEVAHGTHHFGFLVDGEWYIPEDAPDAVPDEWGRTSLTLVIEPEDEALRAPDPGGES